MKFYGFYFSNNFGQRIIIQNAWWFIGLDHWNRKTISGNTRQKPKQTALPDKLFWTKLLKIVYKGWIFYFSLWVCAVKSWNQSLEGIFFSGDISTRHLSTKLIMYGTKVCLMSKCQCKLAELARTYLQTPLRLPDFFHIGQWNRFKYTEVCHLTDPLALKSVRNGTKVSLMGSLMGFVMGL